MEKEALLDFKCGSMFLLVQGILFIVITITLSFINAANLVMMIAPFVKRATHSYDGIMPKGNFLKLL